MTTQPAAPTTVAPFRPFVVAAPCAESWNAMRNDGSARFCDACQTHVVDLATLSAREIRALATITGGSFCARQTLVDGELVIRAEAPPRTTVTPLKRFVVRTVLAAGALSAAYSLPAAAYGPEPIATSPADPAALPLPGLDSPRVPGQPGQPGQSDQPRVPNPQADPVANEPKREHFMGKIAPPTPSFPQSILFGRKSSTITASDEALLADIARVLASHSWVRAIVIHASASDDEGSTAERQALGQARAQAVRDRLIALGVAADRLTIDPALLTHTADSDAERARQRVVTFSVE